MHTKIKQFSTYVQMSNHQKWYICKQFYIYNKISHHNFSLTTIWTYILIKPYFKLKYCSSNGLMWMWLEQVCERACDWSKSHSSFIIKFWKQVLVYKWILGNYFQLQFLQAQSSGKLNGTELIISFICF